MTYKLRKTLCLVVLILWLPVYIVLAATVMEFIDRPMNAGWSFILMELLIYVVLGVLWALPFRPLFRGIGRPDPDAPPQGDDQV